MYGGTEEEIYANDGTVLVRDDDGKLLLMISEGLERGSAAQMITGGVLGENCTALYEE